jgi:uncharacterized protein (TIGR00251 family)
LTRPGIRERGGEISLEVRLIPRAKKNEIVGWDEAGRLRVRVTAPPVEGAANRALLKLLARRLGISPGRLEVSKGETSRQKTLTARGISLPQAEEALGLTGRNRESREREE